MSALHIEKIANIGVISRTFASDSKEEHPQQLPNTVYTTGQQENTEQLRQITLQPLQTLLHSQ